MQQSHIRNFAIIAHIDHGKSTLADRFLELTKTVSQEKMAEQFLDQNPIGRERGITIKLAPVRMQYDHQGQMYELNLIDTPGHVDFSYEVSRTLAACEGAILLVDATQGVQAQTVAHHHSAVKEGLVLIPVINKIDLPNADVETTVKELVNMFGFEKDEMLFISAKTGENVEAVLDAVVQKIPHPKGSKELPTKALIFDAVYDEYRGVIAYIRVVDGAISLRDSVTFYQSGVKTQVTDIGYFTPFLASLGKLDTGEIGYMVAGIKDIRQARVGDTIMQSDNITTPLPGYTTPKPMVFFGMYPKDMGEFPHLKEALSRITLNDTSLTFTEEYSSYLGSGFRVGFLGLLHAEIVKERIEKEEGVDLLLTMPQVLYEEKNEEFFEPYMKVTVYSPVEYVGAIMTVCQKKKGSLVNLSYHDTRAIFEYEMPYSMFIRGLAADLKTVSSGFASLDYILTDYKKADIVDVSILINGQAVDVLSERVYRDEAQKVAREKTHALKERLPRQQFRQIIQGTVSGTIIAREEIPPFRKDVLAKMSGGDRTRKDKLLDKQKKGKSKMITGGKITLPQDALYSLLKS